jgi:NADH-quinone oxidoreductase subunit F
MDRSVFEGDPHSVLEGMLLGGYAIGASKGYVYIRAEYPIALMRLRAAIQQAKDVGILGKGIFGTDFDFDIEIRIGAGAFVCGEETALMESVEGKRGEPRQKPPFPFQKGLFDSPSISTTWKTLENIRPCFKRRAWFPSIRTTRRAWDEGIRPDPAPSIIRLCRRFRMGIGWVNIGFFPSATASRRIKSYKSAQTGAFPAAALRG